MKHFLTSLSLLFSYGIFAQCTTTDASGCACADGSFDCDLLPDITVSWEAIDTYLSGPNEYPQTGAGINNGRLKVSASTPNIGYGPLTVRGTDLFVCGNDTVVGDPGTCPSGNPPKQLIVQRVYHKNPDGTMTYYDRFAGAMTYHPTHGHNHVDDWAVLTLRIENPNDPNPLNWPIVGYGSKLGFCLMDYGSCSTYPGHCRDTNTHYNQGNTLLNNGFPNYGLGGGNYGCSPVEQGISVGWTDIYSENLDGQWIDIPPGTCNGNYYIVAEIDPLNHFLESDETNNWTAVPVTLTMQDPPGNPTISIQSDLGDKLCSNEATTLTATAGTEYLWSTGDTTQSIQVSQAGSYFVTVTNLCGTGTSQNYNITVSQAPQAPVISGDTLVCNGQSATLTATGSDINWYNSSGFWVGNGNNFITPSLSTTSAFYADESEISGGVVSHVGLSDNLSATGGNFVGDHGLLFDAVLPFTLKSVKVYASGDGNRVIQVLDQAGNIVKSGNYFIPDGESRVELNYEIPAGINYVIKAAQPPNLFRSNSNVVYPYGSADTVLIHGSTNTGSFYYSFYDWEIQVGATSCTSNQSVFTVQVDTCNGINEVNMAEDLHLYPNPNNGMFNFEFNIKGTEKWSYSISNVLGKVVYNKTVGTTTGLYSEQIKLRNLSSGVYSLSVYIGGQQYSKRFVVE